VEAVILAGGEATRLRPLSYQKPKALVPVLNRPFLSYMVEHLSVHGVKNITLAAGHFSKLLEDFVNNYSNVSFNLSVEPNPLGTAGAVKYSLKNHSDTFLVLNGDIFSTLNITDILAFHFSMKSQLTIALTFVENSSSFGVVQTTDDGRITAFTEKPAVNRDISNWVNAGIYVINPSILENIPTDQFYMFETDLFPKLLDKGIPIFGYKHDNSWIDMGTLSKYFSLNSELLLNSGNTKAIQYGINCDISESVILNGPILLGNNVTVGSGSKLFGPVIIGDNSNIGSGVVINNSIIWEKVNLGNNSRVDGSIIGSGENISAGINVLNVAIADDLVNIDRSNDNNK
jgi:mannose-1-phosphate guanylyltransferase